MEWNSSYKAMKEMETRTMMEMVLVPVAEATEARLSPSDRGKGAPSKRKKSITSAYLKFFETTPDGKSRRCKFCRQSYSIATATGNLGRHLSHRHPGYDKLGDNQQAMRVQHVQLSQHAAPVSRRSQPQVKPAVNLDHANWLLLKWLIGACIPLSFFEDEIILNSFKILNSSVKIWPREKIQAVILEVFRSMQEDVKTSLKNLTSKVSVTLDFWSSYEQVCYMSVKCHWIDDNWSMHKVLLDVCQIPFPGTGSEILRALMKVLTVFDLDKKILSCTNDNSRQAIHACLSLKEEMDAQSVPFCFLPCAARTLNQIIEDGLRIPKPLFSKIRAFVLQLNSHPEIAEDFKQSSSLYQEGSWKVPIDASASWNGDYTMLDIVRKAPNAVDSTIKKHEEIFDSRNLLLNASEKDFVNLLHLYLEPFYKITTNLCTCKVPTVGLVLFFVDHVFELISSRRDNCHNEWLKSVIEEMAKSARNINITQVCNFFTFMAAVLDPRIKKELIPEALSSEKNLEEARNYFKRHYSNIQFPAIANGFTTKDDTEEANVVFFAEEIARKRRRMNINSATDELSQYLAEAPVPIATDVLDWWKVNSTRYPQLSLMARDFLAVQGTSVDPVELFTNKGCELRKQQFSLPYSSMQAFMCINSWTHSGYKFKFQSAEIDFDKLVELATTSVDEVKS